MTFYKSKRSRFWYVSFGSQANRVLRTTGFEIREDAKALHDLVKPIYYLMPERFGETFETARLLIHECRVLGIRFEPRSGLIPNAKRIQIRWMELGRMMEKIKERGFGGMCS